MDSLPPELLRYVFQFLPLTSLIAARGVSKKWRTLALTASLHPARKALLDLYLSAIVHPNFPSLIAALKSHLHEFDREAYIIDLTSRGCVLPDLFELWILEWPSKAVHFWAWPGLERFFDMDHASYFEDGNVLAESRPLIDMIPMPKDVATIGHQTCRALALFTLYLDDTVGICQLWIVVDANEQINDRRAGRLVWTLAACDGVHPNGHCAFGPKRPFYDPPFGPTTDIKLIDFLDTLDVSRDHMESTLSRYYITGVHHIVDDE